MALLINTAATVRAIDPRVTELQELAKSEGIQLPMHAEQIVLLEERGYVVDMTTGDAVKLTDAIPTASGLAVAYLLGDTPSPALDAMNDIELNALLEEVYGKPGLGAEDSAGLCDFDLFDYDGELEDQIEGRLDNEDWATGRW